MKEFVSPWGWPDELKSWSWPGQEGKTMQVHVYTRSKLVKLELNGKVIGEQAVDGEKSITATFEVPYAPGTLVARCYDGDKEIASQTLKTVGDPAAIRLTADRATIKADPNDLAYVMAEVVDADGNVIPWADSTTISFQISGAGTLAGVANGNPKDMASFKQPVRKTYMGACLLIARTGREKGTITIIATAEGLKDGKTEVVVQ
jgi:beta-galactosidase